VWFQQLEAGWLGHGILDEGGSKECAGGV
jgi:hypothetical protein